VTGTGGELGRAFHYALLARNRRSPDLRQLRQAWRPEERVPDARRAAVAAAADEAVRGALAVPGVSGWRALDVVYATMRMRWWARAGIRATGGALAALFLAPAAASALARCRSTTGWPTGSTAGRARPRGGTAGDGRVPA
jgi:hypothetical protein